MNPPARDDRVCYDVSRRRSNPTFSANVCLARYMATCRSRATACVRRTDDISVRRMRKWSATYLWMSSIVTWLSCAFRRSYVVSKVTGRPERLAWASRRLNATSSSRTSDQPTRSASLSLCSLNPDTYELLLSWPLQRGRRSGLNVGIVICKSGTGIFACSPPCQPRRNGPAASTRR